MIARVAGILVALLVGACSENTGGPVAGPSAVAQVAVALPAPPLQAGVIGGPLGASLRQDDREIGTQAQRDALEKGAAAVLERSRWRVWLG